MTMAVGHGSGARVIRVIAGREARAAVAGLGGHLALAVAVAAAAWVHLVDVRALAAGGLLAVADPLRAPLAAALLTLALYLAVSATVSAARDRESGTLEVLFYGPVDEVAYVLGKAGGLLVAYIAALPILLVALAALSWISGFAMTTPIVVATLLSVVPAAEIVAFGVLLSLATRRVRTAVMLLAATLILLLGTALAYDTVLLVPVTDPASPILALRDTLGAVDQVVRWLSPFAYFDRVVGRAVDGSWQAAATSVAAATLGAVAFTLAAVLALRVRGVTGSDG